MIPVMRADEPTDFETRVRRPGLDAINEMTGKAPSRQRRGPKRKKIADKPEDIRSDDFQVVRGPGAVGDLAARVDETIDNLGLNRDECCKARQEYVDDYLDSADPLPIAYLDRRAPFVAREMRRQRLLRTGDQ